MGVKTEKNEIFEAGFYRSPGGFAVVKLPELDGKKWTVIHREKEGWRYLHLFAGNMENYVGKISFTFPPGYVFKGKVTADSIARTIVKETLSTAPYLKQATEPTVDSVAGGEAAWIGLKGTNDNNVDVAFVVVGIIDSKDTTYGMWMIMEAAEDIYSMIGEVANKIFDTLYVGKHVPVLEDRKPDTRLEGVYLSANNKTRHGYEIIFTDYWFIFDRRGYCYGGGPAGELMMDMDALFVYDKSKVRPYNVEGDILVMENAEGKKQQLSIKKIDNKRYEIDGYTYVKMDFESVDGMTLDGCYSSTYSYSNEGYLQDFQYYSSNRYYFSRKGRFSIKNFSSSHSNFYGSDLSLDGVVDSVFDDEPAAGTYHIKNHRLILRFNNGRIVSKTFFPKIYKENEDVKRIYIDGVYFTK